MSNHTGQLSRQSDKQRLFTFVETPTFLLLNDEHPYRVALVNNRHPKEAAISLLTNAWYVSVFGMTNHLFDVNGFSTLRDVSNQPFPNAEGNLAYQSLVQPASGSKH